MKAPAMTEIIERKMHRRDGLEVYINAAGTISIEMESPIGDENDIIAVHPDDLETLIGFLRETKLEIEAIQKDEAAHLAGEAD